MLQRIQTLYLLLVGIFAILLIFLPLGNFPNEGEKVPLGILGLGYAPGVPNALPGYWQAFVLATLVLLILILTFYTIFQYKRRRFQIQLGKFNTLLHMGLIVTAFLLIDQLSGSSTSGNFRYGVGIFLPLVSMVLIFLANRAIKKDDELVRSADRIR